MPCSPGMRACRRDCLHRAAVVEYHAARQAWCESAEHATALYRAELEAYQRDNTPITFKAWLEGRAQRQEAAA